MKKEVDVSQAGWHLLYDLKDAIERANSDKTRKKDNQYLLEKIKDVRIVLFSSKVE